MPRPSDTHYQILSVACRSLAPRLWPPAPPLLLLAVIAALLLSNGTAAAQSFTATPTPTATARAKLPAPALTATYAGSDAIELTWNAVPGAVTYRLVTWWASEPGWQQIGGDNLTATYFTHRGLTRGRTYHYAIRAFDAGGAEGEWTAAPYPIVTVPAAGELTATATANPAATVLDTPNLTDRSTTNGVLLAWNAVPGATRYELLSYWASNPGWQPVGGDNLTALTYMHADVTPESTYHYAIRALNPAGDASPWTSTDFPFATALATPVGETSTPTPAAAGAATSTSTPSAAPTPPAAALATPNLTAQATAYGVLLTWNAVPGAARYELLTYWAADPGWQPIGGDNLTATTYTHTELSAGIIYYYTIRARNAAGVASPWIRTGFPAATALAVQGTATSTPSPTPSATVARTHTVTPTPTFTPTPTVTPTVAGADRGALIALYRATNGDNWINKDNWLTSAPLNAWYGVTASHSGHVHQLALDSNNLTGPIPDLSALSDIYLLTLRSNQLRGPIPNLSALTRLRILDLSHNRLSGPFPDLSNLALLETLSIESNQLSGPILNLQFLESLTVLWLNDNRFTGPLPDLRALTELEQLRLEGNSLCLPGGAILSHQNGGVAQYLMTLNLPACAGPELSLPSLSALDLTANVSTSRVSLSWDAAAGAESYELRFWDSLNRRWESPEGRLVTTTYTHPVLSDGRIYYFQVRARFAGGQTGQWSRHLQAIVVPQRYPPPPPSLRIDLFYQKYLKVNGVIIVAPSEVSDAAMERAAAIVAGMFAGNPVMFDARPDKRLRIALFKRNAQGERAIQVPEMLRAFSDSDGAAIPTAHEWISIVPEDDWQYCYVFIHETAHAIHFALEDQPDGQEFKSRLEALYHAALDTGLWGGAYASTNVYEYWAETVTFWFHEHMHEPFHLAGTKLERYDPEIAKLIAETFGDEAYVPDYCKP